MLYPIQRCSYDCSIERVCDSVGTSYLRHGTVITNEMVHLMMKELLFTFYCGDRIQIL